MNVNDLIQATVAIIVLGLVLSNITHFQTVMTAIARVYGQVVVALSSVAGKRS